MSSKAEHEAEGFRSFVRASGLDFYEHWSMPTATQTLRHNEFGMVPRVGIGDLPDSLPDGWIGQIDVGQSVGSGGGHMLTAIVVGIPQSIKFAVRMVCHDRDLPASLRRNPEADEEVIELSDHSVELESEAFVKRYIVGADHDQDATRVWQVFSPEVIEFLTDGAPQNFSFELQQGALCCFLPGEVDDPAQLAELCHAAKLVYDRIAEIAASDPTGAPAGETRDSIVDKALAEHPFDKPPKSVWAAARHFAMAGRESWKLGSEAFFRGYVSGIGFEHASEAEFRAGHINPCVIGAITHVAKGRLPDIGYDAWLALSTDSSAWVTLMFDAGEGVNLYTFADLPKTDEVRKHGFDVTADPTTLYVFRAQGGHSKKALDEFMATAHPFAKEIVDKGAYH